MNEILVPIGETQKITATVTKEASGKRLDAAIPLLFEKISRTRAQSLIEDASAEVNGVITTSKKQTVKEGDEVSITLQPLAPLDIQPEDIPLDIVCEDEDLIVIDKPQGMVVHPAPGSESGTLVNALMYHCKDLSGINGALRPGIVHRIDKNTSGLLVVAKSDEAHAGLSEQFAEHTVGRLYEAIACGVIKEDEGTVDKYLTRDPVGRKKQVITTVGSGRRAITHYKVLKRFEAHTLIECRLETGRTHQIRVHMQSIGHPLLGDDMYGNPKQTKPEQSNGQYLHAKTLSFTHPKTKERMEFLSPLPDYFTEELKKLSFD
jgi:23S rRNA pseudouridine1911/1915/1917 synthase